MKVKLKLDLVKFIGPAIVLFLAVPALSYDTPCDPAAQFAALVVGVETDLHSFCRVKVTTETINRYDAHRVCRLSLAKILDDGILFPMGNYRKCEISVGQEVSGTLVQKEDGIYFD